MDGSPLQGGTFADPPALPDTSWKLAGVGDFSGDQQPDLLWRHDVSGEVVVWFLEDHKLAGGQFTNPSAVPDTNWKIVAVGDYNADGHNDIVWRHATTGENVVWLMEGVKRLAAVATSPSAVSDAAWRIVGPR